MNQQRRLSLSLFLILSLLLSACGAVPATDWCYTVTSGFVGNTSSQDGNFYLSYTRAAFTPEYVEVFFTNSSGAPDNAIIDAEGWGIFSSGSRVIPAGSSSVWLEAGSSGTNGYLSGEGVLNTSVSGVKFYGNGTNPFPANECAPAATATPSPTSTPSGPVSLNSDVTPLLVSVQQWLDGLGFLWVVGAITIASSIAGFVVARVVGSIRGRYDE
jgi:hypothetical protein